jgi:predicted lipoprotein with Yx(FWY)xxD motif
MLKHPRYIVLIGALTVLLLAACSGQAASTATPVPIEVSAEDNPEQDKDQTKPEDEQVREEEGPATLEPEDEQVEEEEVAVTNAVVAKDQALGSDNTVTIASIIADTDSWLVIHAQADGKPGTILGKAPVRAGENSDVIIEIDSTGATETMYAMLHVDAGVGGEFEFPNGDDVPAIDADGNIVTPPFIITGGLSSSLTVDRAESAELGFYLTDAAGMSLYTFAADVPGTSNCYERCAVAWPPLLIEDSAELTAGGGIPGDLGTTQRDDDTIQVTYNEWPLYYWINDEAPGDTNGHNVNNVWAVAYPTTHLFLGGNDDLGRFLVGPEGMTLYRFNPDEPGTSACYDQCAANWPPLLVGDGEMPGGNAGVVGKLDTTERDDGTMQITYEGMPLYYWVNDSAPGDATGHGVNDIWFVVPPLTVQVGNSGELGDFLVGANGMTLYLFTVDEEGLSTCYEQCAANWPPVLVQPGEALVPGAGVTGELGVAERDDGSLQVIYDGKPLYYWVNDQAPGDTTGQGVNDVWFVVAP